MSELQIDHGAVYAEELLAYQSPNMSKNQMAEHAKLYGTLTDIFEDSSLYTELADVSKDGYDIKAIGINSTVLTVLGRKGRLTISDVLTRVTDPNRTAVFTASIVDSARLGPIHWQKVPRYQSHLVPIKTEPKAFYGEPYAITPDTAVTIDTKTDKFSPMQPSAMRYLRKMLEGQVVLGHHDVKLV